MAPSLDAVWIVPVDELASWVEEREAILIEHENETFRAARDRAATAEERARWDAFIAAREANLSKARERKAP